MGKTNKRWYSTVHDGLSSNTEMDGLATRANPLDVKAGWEK